MAEIGLVSCTKAKHEQPAPPGELYSPSTLFSKAGFTDIALAVSTCADLPSDVLPVSGDVSRAWCEYTSRYHTSCLQLEDE